MRQAGQLEAVQPPVRAALVVSAITDRELRQAVAVVDRARPRQRDQLASRELVFTIGSAHRTDPVPQAKRSPASITGVSRSISGSRRASSLELLDEACRTVQAIAQLERHPPDPESRLAWQPAELARRLAQEA